MTADELRRSIRKHLRDNAERFTDDGILNAMALVDCTLEALGEFAMSPGATRWFDSLGVMYVHSCADMLADEVNG